MSAKVVSRHVIFIQTLIRAKNDEKFKDKRNFIYTH